MIKNWFWRTVGRGELFFVGRADGFVGATPAMEAGVRREGAGANFGSNGLHDFLCFFELF